MGIPIIKGVRVRDTRDDSVKILRKTLGDTLYFSDDTKASIEEYNIYFVLVNSNES